MANEEESDALRRYAEEKRRKLEYNSKFNVEAWSTILSGCTFPTFTLPMTLEEGLALARWYKVYVLHHDADFTDEQQTLLENLEQRIDDVIRNDCDGDAFVRMGSRSPKDTPLFDGPDNIAYARLKKIMKEKIRAVHQANYQDPLLYNNAIYATLMESGTEALRITNGREAMHLLQNSERTYVDLLLSLDCRKDSMLPKDEIQKVIIRKWDNRLPYHGEFRCFVHNYSMNAISQYDNYCYFPQLFETEGRLQEKEKLMRDYYQNQVRPLLEQANFPPHFVIDLGVLINNTVTVIELNPADNDVVKGTGSAMFSWSRDADVIQGRAPFEMRVNKSPPFSNYEEQVAPDWMELQRKIENEVIEEEKERNRYCIIA
jgi:hypothetical protein